ncbi:TIR domain-containing protein [Mucilaginibacter gossypiicola]|uniref:TIR domain-containing protein n=1 Tax=Mucilaginibacter gossypiicola TaxID=551995 RepID=A0A1H8V0A1_9SPHI|nr:toll/interleukin-1 receptor domain-containing protein [Mucilaginibacter gossypiicola]SEP08819.1 TIR domain-containing protein [Mucilaginibacter gossypiicola]
MSLLNKQDFKNRSSQKHGLNSRLKSIVNLNESSKSFSYLNKYDIFLSHSFLDAEDVDTLRQDLQDAGFSVYVDWIDDNHLTRENVTSYTATVIRNRMKQCKSLIYAFSVNSVLSKWAQWELGYFDGIDGKVSIAPIFETSQSGEEYKGAEFLGLYPYVTKTLSSFYVHEASDIWVSYSGWLNNSMPVKR